MTIEFDLKNYLTKKKLSIKKVSAVIDVHPDTLYKAMRKGSVNVDIINRLEHYFGKLDGGGNGKNK